MIRLLFVFALCVAYLFPPACVQAQQSEYVTARNISSFALYQRSDRALDLAATVACRAQGTDRRLGRLTLAGQPSTITVGALFVPLSPTISEQEARLRKKINSGLRAVKRSGSARAKKQAQRGLKKVRGELSKLLAYQNFCSTFVPAIPESNNPPPNAPSPTNPQLPNDPSSTPEAEYFVDDAGEGPTHTCSPTTVIGTVSGDGHVLVTLANDSFVETQDASSGSFAFAYVPTGEYSLFAESEGASFGAAHKVIVRTDGQCNGISLTRQNLPETDAFAFRWRQQGALTSGIEQFTKTTAGTSEDTLKQVSLSQPSSASRALQSSAANKLLSKFLINLDSSELSWGSEHAERLHMTLERLWPAEYGGSPITKPSYWVLTSEHLPGDIALTQNNDNIEVRVNAEAFRYAALSPAVLDGVRGQFFSERLMLAAARFLSQDGRDRGVIEQIFNYRFHTYIVNDLNVACWMTYDTTKECAESFQLFSNDELLQIMAALAQLPSSEGQAAQNIYLLRRKDGVRHPQVHLDSVRIIPYTDKKLSAAYIEFSRDAFLPLGSKSMDDPRQPVKELLLPGIIAAHASMIWDRIITDELKRAWITETGWSQDPFTGAFVNDNPTELGAMLPAGVIDRGPKGDFATSVAKYISAPEELRFRSARRFEFLKLYVMHGLRYSRQFREDLKFPVLNLRPDFSYPGKVKEAELVLTGAPDQDKNVRLKITLEGNDPLEHGASQMYITLRRQGRTSEPIYLSLQAHNPDPVYGTSVVLRTNQSISKYLPSGFYEVDSIASVDNVGNTRFQHGNSLGLKFYLKNSLTPPKPAELVPESMKLSLSETIVHGVTVPMFTTEFKVKNPEALQSASDYMINLNTPRGYLASNPIARRAGDTVRISRPVSPFLPSDVYGLLTLHLSSTGSKRDYSFSLDAGLNNTSYLPMPLVEYENSNGDVTPPEVDLNSIRVTAQTLAPERPNGATRVVVNVKAKDDLAGLQHLTFCLRSPLDRVQCSYFNLDLKTEMLPDGTTEIKDYQAALVLPAGSAPGDWGVDRIIATDRVGNTAQHELTEIVKFIVDNKSAQ